MEFSFENDPNIHVWYDGFQLWVQFQYASVGGQRCDDKSNWDRLKYTMYVTQFDHNIEVSGIMVKRNSAGAYKHVFFRSMRIKCKKLILIVALVNFHFFPNATKVCSLSGSL